MALLPEPNLKNALSVADLYKADPKLSRDSIQAFAEWASKQAHFPQLSELHLIYFLKCNKYRLEPAKTALDNFLTVRTLCPEIFASILDESLLRTTAENAFINILPQRTPEGFIVLYSRLLNTHPDAYNDVHQVRLNEMVTLNDLLKNGPPNGVVVIMDMAGMTFGHIARANLSAMKKYIFYVQEAAPVKIQSINYVNMVPFSDRMLGLIKPFMKKEMIDTLQFHAESMDSLYKFVPKEILPKDVGGNAPTFDELNKKTLEELIENRMNFEWNDSFKVDESKRMNKIKHLDDVFGVDGSFKKLDFD